MSKVDFFFNDTATTEIYTLSLHDALPISFLQPGNVSTQFGYIEDGDFTRLREVALTWRVPRSLLDRTRRLQSASVTADRKSTRLNSSHANISYAAFCLKKKKNVCFLRISS